MKSKDTADITEAHFQQFISEGATRLTPRALHELVSELPEMRSRFAEIGAAGFPKAERQLALLADALERFATERTGDLPYKAALEAAFALSYFHRDVDLNPDTLGSVGFADDAAVIEIAFSRNAGALRDFAKANGHDWSKVAAQPAVT